MIPCELPFPAKIGRALLHSYPGAVNILSFCLYSLEAFS